MFKRIRIPAVLVGLVAILSLSLACGGGAVVDQTPTPTPKNTPTPSVEPTPTKAPTETRMPTPVTGGTKAVVYLRGSLGLEEDYAFDPWNTVLRVGTEYTIELVGGVEGHTFTVPELGIDVQVGPQETRYVALKVDKPGEYKLFCRPHEHLGMVGRVSVR